MTLTTEQINVVKGTPRVPYATFKFPPGAEFNLGEVAIEVYSKGAYNGILNKNGEPSIDPTDSILFTIGKLDELKLLSSDSTKFEEAYTFLFQELNIVLNTKIAALIEEKTRNLSSTQLPESLPNE